MFSGILFLYLIGLVGAIGICYIDKCDNYARHKDSLYHREYLENWTWCPSPINIIFIMFVGFFGPFTLLMALIMGIMSLVPILLSMNTEKVDAFVTWLSTPICGKKK